MYKSLKLLLLITLVQTTLSAVQLVSVFLKMNILNRILYNSRSVTKAILSILLSKHSYLKMLLILNKLSCIKRMRRAERNLILQDTPVTPYTRLPVFTDSAIRDRSRDCCNLRQSIAICHVLPYSAYLFLPQYLRYPQRPWLLPNSAKSTEFC